MTPLIEQYKELSELTTFHLAAKARYFARYNTAEALKKLLHTETFRDNDWLHIGAGSNLLFLGDFNGLVLKSDIFGRQAYRKNDDTVFAIAGAGENWSDFVDWCVEQNLAGLENLAGIPGEVGASPVQNVGAYGVEAGDLIHTVEVMDVTTGEVERIKGSDCGFGYRESRFKHEWKGRYIVLRVSFRLHPDTKARNLEYGPMKELEQQLGHHPTIAEVRDKVKELRSSKLPDPDVLGSAGSFFRNPVVDSYYFNEVVKPLAPGIVAYPVADGSKVKLGAGWMIEHAGLKGAIVGDAEVYPNQCLVIVNRGNATYKDVEALAEKVQTEVRRRFNVELRPEVNYISTRMDIEVLGSGTSKGVPEIGCLCPVCTSPDPHDNRLRSSVWLRTHGLSILIDPSPDFRQQALRAGISHIDAVLLTHSHYDHVGGIDDLRPFCITSDVPIYAQQDVIDDLKRRLDYCFYDNPYPGVPRLILHPVEANKVLDINGLNILPLRVMHGKKPILGYRIGSFGYITDASSLPEETADELHDLQVLILNALRIRPHFAHYSLQEALDVLSDLKPKEAYLTHFSHEIGKHADVEPTLPDSVKLAYDGLKLRIQ